VFVHVFQVIKVQQTTVDAYLEDIVSLAIDRTANAQARQEVQQMAAIINDTAYEAEQRSILFVTHYLRQGESNEHWRRLRDWSFCLSFRVCMYILTHSGNDVIAPIAQAATLAVTFLSLCEVALPSLSPLFVVGCSSSSSNV